MNDQIANELGRDAEPATFDEIMEDMTRYPDLANQDLLMDCLRYAFSKLKDKNLDNATEMLRAYEFQRSDVNNPDELTSKQIDTKNGWRLLLKSEVGVIGDCPSILEIECWIGGILEWFGSKWNGSDTYSTYRTRLTPQELRKARGLE